MTLVDTEPAAPPAHGRSKRRIRPRYVVVGAILVGAFAFLAFKGLTNSLNYFDTVDEAMAQKAALGSQTFRLEGLVQPGSVERTATGVDFVASGSKYKVVVHNTGNPPQLFQPDIPVVVVGHFDGAVFLSNQIIVDHSSQYIEEYPNRVRAPNGTVR